MALMGNNPAAPPKRPPKASSSSEGELPVNPYESDEQPAVPFNPYAKSGRSKSVSGSSSSSSSSSNNNNNNNNGPPPSRPPRIERTKSEGSSLLITNHPTRARPSPAASRRRPTNKNDEIRQLRQQVEALSSGGASAASSSGGGDSSSSAAALEEEIRRLNDEVESLRRLGGGGDDALRAELDRAKKERDNFRLLAKKLQQDARKSKVEAAQQQRNSIVVAGTVDEQVRELQARLAAKDALVQRLQASSSSSSSMSLIDGTGSGSDLERERLARQREELQQMRADEAKAEVAKLRGQLVQLKRIMDRKVAELEQSLEDETRANVNLLAEKRSLQQQIDYNGGRIGSAPADYAASPGAGSTAPYTGYPMPNLRRNSQHPSGTAPLLSEDFGNPPPLNPRPSQPKRNTVLCDCVIS